MPNAAVFNVRDYGAIGDGVANDRGAIQAAADAAYAAGGCTVYIPAGVYGLSSAGFTSTYAGIQIRSGVSIEGAGMGATVIKVLDGDSVGFTGVLRTPVNEITTFVSVSGLTIDGNRANTTGKVDGFFCGTLPGAGTASTDITLSHVEVMNCSGYGIDPHEQTLRTLIENCVSHGNGLDGFTLDFQVDAVLRNNVAYDNDRHGFNIVTQSHDMLMQGNVAYDNGSAGIVVQRGSTDVPSPFNVVIEGGSVYGNLDGILLKMADDVSVSGVHIHDNQREGVKIYGSSGTEITDSLIENNSQAANNGYSQVYITPYNDGLTGSVFEAAGSVITGNTITSTGDVRASYGVRETATVSGSLIDDNVVSGAVRGATSTGPQIREAMPDLHAPTDSFTYQISHSAYVDIDAQDTVTLSVQAVDETGALLDGGVLPSWLSFDAARGVISGAPEEAQSIHLRVTATDKSGAQEFDMFDLTASDAGTYNVQSAPSGGGQSVFNVRDYGAVGDGVANDRLAIQRAVDAAAQAGGGIVYVPTGTYIIGTAGVNKTYAGIQLSDNITFTGDGAGLTTLKVADGNNSTITGVVRTPYGIETHNVTVSNLTIDGNRDQSTSGKVDGFYCGTAPGAGTQDTDITVTNVEIKDCSGYGFDPHEQTVRLTIEDCVSHGNGLDGFTLDYIIDSTIRNNVSYDNDRHGFNVVTSSYDSVLEGNVAYGNGGNGITVQRGAEDIPSPHDLLITGGEVYDNDRAGILLQMTNNVTVDGVHVHGNDREGIKLYGASDITITGSTIENNSQAGNGTYSEIYLTSIADDVTGRTWTTTGATITDNTITDNGTVRAGYGVRETVETTGSIIDGNVISGATKGATLTGPQVRQEMPDLDAPSHAFQKTIDAGAYVDIDANDTVTLSLQQLTAGGQLAGTGALPAWLTFDPQTRTISGAPTSADAGTVYLRVVATDKSGNAEYDPFTLTVTAGPADYSTPPTVAHPLEDQQAEPNEAFNYAVPADTFADADLGDSLQLSAVLAAGGPLPTWLTFNAQTGTFTGQPGSADVGTLQVRVVATDRAGGSTSDVFALVTTSQNDAPVVAQPIADQTAVIGEAYSLTVPAGAFTDADPGDTLTYSATLDNGDALPSWLTFNASTRTFSGTPTGQAALQVKVTATDTANAKASDIFALNVAAGAQRTGTAGDDLLTGTSGQDTLQGLAGNDRLDGRGGADQMIGGDGDDTYVVDDAGDVVTEVFNSGAGGVDKVEASISYVLAADVENLVLTGSADINATGNNKANLITGNAVANVIDGGAGNDTMAGGAGNDTYKVGQTADVVTEAAGEGTDTVISAVSYTIGANVENLTLEGSASTGTGNEAANVITGNDGANKLYGLGGNDTLDGGAGADSLYGGAGDDTYYVDSQDSVVEVAGEGTDTVYSAESHTLKVNVENLILSGSGAVDGTGNGSANVLTGNGASNTLSGQAGDDILDGGGGRDTLTGGSGADRFVFSDAAHSTGALSDLITDFKTSESDRIDVSKIDANSALSGDQGFTWAAAFSGQAGQVVATFDSAANQTLLSFDINGDGLGNEFAIRITGHPIGTDWLIL